MSVRVSTWVWHETTAKGNDRLLLLALADNANDDGWCWPGIAQLVDKTCLGRATVFRRLDVLEAGGLVERFTRQEAGRTTVYRVLVPWADSTSWPADLGPHPGGSQIGTGGSLTAGTGGVSRVGRGASHGRDTEPSLNRQGTVSGARKRASRIDPDFSVSPEMRSWATEKGYGSLDLDAITEDFVDYWLARSGAEAAKLDWARTWQRWVRKEAQAGRGPVARPQRSSWDRAIEVGSPEWNARHGRGDVR